MNPPPFQPQTELSRALIYKFKTGKVERRLHVLRWQDRLVAHEESSGLWWGTLDAQDERNAWEFWHQSVADGRIGRLFSWESGLGVSNLSGAALFVKPQLLHVLVAHDNSGAIRVADETTWYTFAPTEPWGLHKPLAHRPVIWSPRFHFRFAQHGINQAYEMAGLAQLPTPIHTIWEQGATAPALQLVAAADALGWSKAFWGKWSPLPQFWQMVLRHRAQIPETAQFSLPNALLQSSEVALLGKFFTWNHPRFKYCAVFEWKNPKVTLRVEFGSSKDPTQASEHERLEAGRELRHWLLQFFPASEVESWFMR